MLFAAWRYLNLVFVLSPYNPPAGTITSVRRRQKQWRTYVASVMMSAAGGVEGIHMNRTALIALLCTSLVVACDDERAAVPKEVLEQSAAPPEPGKGKKKIPTTQELVSGPRSRTALMPLPLTMELPPGWGKFEDVNDALLNVAAAGINLLQGRTPNGEVQIQLTAKPALKQETLDQLMAGGKKEMAEKPDEIVKLELRDLGNVKIMERQKVGKPAPLATFDANGNEHITTESPFNWTISVLVPSEGAFQVYELNFIGLTKSQYDKDATFLTGVINTLAYGATPTTAPASTAPAAPGPV
jgi:hypothetical protein